MPLKLRPPRAGKTPYYYIRGTYLGVYVEESTGTGRREIAEQLLRKKRDEIECGAVARPGEPTFAEAAPEYASARRSGSCAVTSIWRTSKTPITAADLLNDRVLPFFEEHDVKLLRVLTDRGSEFCGNPERHEYELYLAVEDIDHSRTKTKSRRPTASVNASTRPRSTSLITGDGLAIDDAGSRAQAL